MTQIQFFTWKSVKYTAISLLIDTDYGPETRVAFYNPKGERVVRQESASVEQIIQWFKESM